MLAKAMQVQISGTYAGLMDCCSAALGRIGEELASEYLINSGFDIAYRNVRYIGGEIDLIAVKNKQLWAIEVRTRRASFYGPLETIDANKQKRIIRAMQFFLQDKARPLKNKEKLAIYFGAIGIRCRNNEYMLEFVPDAFYLEK